MSTPAPIPLGAIREAQSRLAGTIVPTPLVPLNADTSEVEIFLKPENLQPVGSFKLRGAANAMKLARGEQLDRGIWTASTGNMAQGVAWCAQQMGLSCTVVVYEGAAEGKISAIERLGATVVRARYDDWLQIFRSRRYEGLPGLFIHPFNDPAVMAGNGTLGLEVLSALPDVDAIVLPFGGGGLSSGVASALRALKPATRIYACEAETAAPLAAAFAAGKPVRIEYRASFVDGIGAPFVFEEMWGLVRQLIDGSLVVSLEEVASAIRLLAERNHLIAEGAGAAAVAAAMAGKAGNGKVVCVISGGNIDPSKLVRILQGEVP